VKLGASGNDSDNGRTDHYNWLNAREAWNKEANALDRQIVRRRNTKLPIMAFSSEVDARFG
jgi:hypothetical protein